MNNQSDIPHFEKRIGGIGVVGDASDFEIISRPRLWWLTANWNNMDHILKTFTDMGPVSWG